jgi:hypothetical protein
MDIFFFSLVDCVGCVGFWAIESRGESLGIVKE